MTEMNGNRITMLGTGNALATLCYNTCTGNIIVPDNLHIISLY